jgi:hypothetical protein
MTVGEAIERLRHYDPALPLTAPGTGALEGGPADVIGVGPLTVLAADEGDDVYPYYPDYGSSPDARRVLVIHLETGHGARGRTAGG